MIIIGSWMFIQFLGGLWTGSLALLADAVHMFNDFSNLFISLIAIILAAKAATKRRTFGNHRYEVLSSLLNSLALLAIVFFVVKEAIDRIISPQDVMGGAMMIIAIIGLIANIGATKTNNKWYECIYTNSKKHKTDLPMKVRKEPNSRKS